VKGFYIGVIRSVRRLLARLGILRWMESKKDSFGWRYLRSLFSIYDAQDMATLDLPWWTFSAIEAVEKYLRGLDGSAEVFEYGAGASTVWLARRSKQVCYVEHDEGFGETLQEMTKGFDNVAGWVVPGSQDLEGEIATSQRAGYEGVNFSRYVRSIRQANGPFDLIVIDGRAREACLQEALGHLKPSGVIVFDNSARARYRKGIDEAPVAEAKFQGLAPALPYKEQTSILRLSA